MINIAVAYILSHDTESLNTKAAMVHVIGDLLGSLAALVSGVVIFFTGWMLIDPILSLAISILILYSTFHVLRASIRVIMEGVPDHVKLELIRKTIAETEGVISIDDLHIWTVSSAQTALSAHIRIEDFQEWHRILDRLHDELHHKFGIQHITIQPVSITSIVSPQKTRPV